MPAQRMPTTREAAKKLYNGELILGDKKSKGKIWAVYSIITNLAGQELDVVYCRSCKQIYKYSQTQVSNLITHKCYVEKFSTIGGDGSMRETENSYTESIETFNNNLKKLFAKWVIIDCMPYDLTQNQNLKAIFQELVNMGSKFGGDLVVTNVLPNILDVAENVSEIYEQCFLAVKSEISLIKENGFGLTIDIFTDDFSKLSYIALTIHYLKNGMLAYRLLGLKTLDGEKRSGEHIVEKVKQILEDFDCKLSWKSVIVTDGTTDIFKTVSEAQNVLCVSRLLNDELLKAVTEIPEISEIINACSELIKFLKQIDINGLLLTSLYAAFPNCWLAVNKMLKSVDSNWSEIEKILQSRNAHAQILTINIHNLKAVIKAFQPFEEAIETLEDDKCGTIYLVWAYLHRLKKLCDTNDSEFTDFDFIETFKKNMHSYLDKIVTEKITIFHKLALFLYPPTNKLLKFNKKEKKSIEDECIRLMKCLNNEMDPIVKQEPEPPSTPLSKQFKLFSDFLESEKNRDPNKIIIQEIQYYKNTPVINSSNFDPFSWWEQHKDNFPLLYKLSCTILATPATCAASKRIFSAAGNLLCRKVKEYSHETEIEKIMFINLNAEHDALDTYFTA